MKANMQNMWTLIIQSIVLLQTTMAQNHTNLLQAAKAVSLSTDELNIMGEELQHDCDVEEMEVEHFGSDMDTISGCTTGAKMTSPTLLFQPKAVPNISSIKRKCQAPKSKKFVEEDTHGSC